MSQRLLSVLFYPRRTVGIIIFSLMAGMIIVVDTFLTILIASQWGVYVTLALVLISSLLGVLFAWGSLRRHFKAVVSLAKTGEFPKMEYAQICGLYCALLLLLLPGFLTDALGWLLYFPLLRIGLGSLIVRRYKREFVGLYEDLQVRR
jgi:UPF0716 protein FxsA